MRDGLIGLLVGAKGDVWDEGKVASYQRKLFCLYKSMCASFCSELPESFGSKESVRDRIKLQLPRDASCARHACPLIPIIYSFRISVILAFLGITLSNYNH